MATDNAVMRYKDIKYYNEKLQDSMPSGGGVSSLADLGITLSAAEINNLPTAISNCKIKYIDSSFTLTTGQTYWNLPANLGKTKTLLGGIVYTDSWQSLFVTYFNTSAWYARITTTTSITSNITIILRTIYIDT